MDEVRAEVTNIITKLMDRDFLKSSDADTLSYVAVRLSAHGAYIGDAKVTAYFDMNHLEVEMYREKAEAFIRAKVEHKVTGAGDAKYADPKFIEAQKKYYAAKAHFEELRYLATSIHDMVDAIKTRVIYLYGQQKDEKTFS